MDFTTIIILVVIGILFGKIIHNQIKDNRDHQRYIKNIRKINRSDKN
jgi:hypothetical protein